MTDNGIDQDIIVSEFSEVAASDFVTEAIREFGSEVNEFNFPSPIDGTKQVHRCILSAVKKDGTDIKSASIIGDIQKIHPHGDATIYNTMCNLSAPFRYALPVVKIVGKGPTYGNTPADMRYTDFAITPVFRALYHDIHDNCIPMTYSKSKIPIPRYYIPVIPLALLNGFRTVGVGFNGNDVPRGFTNICDLAIAYIKHMDTKPTEPFPITNHARKLLPEFNIPCTVLNIEELEHEYSKGNFNAPILVEGSVVLHKNTIVLETLMPTADFHRQGYMKLHDMIAGANKKLRVESVSNACDTINSRDSRSTTKARVEVELKGNNNPFVVWGDIIKHIPFKSVCTPAPRYNDPVTGVDRIMSPLEILSYWYDARARAVRTDIESRLAALYAELSMLTALLIVVDHTDDVVQLLRTSESDIAAINDLRVKYGMTNSQARCLVKLPLITITNSSREELVQKRDACQATIEATEQELLRIHGLMIDSIQKLKKRYADNIPSLTRYGRYIGYVKLYGKYIIQIESTNEISPILDRFKRREADVVVYTAPPKAVIRMVDGKPEKYTKSVITEGDIITSPYSPSATYTVSIRPNGNVVVNHGMRPPLDDGTRTFYLPNKVIRVNTNRTLSRIKLRDAYTLRKHVDAVGLISDALWFLPDEPLIYVATMSSDKIGNLFIQRITSDSTRFIMPMGKLLMYSYSLTGEDWYITLNDECREKVGIKTVYCIPNAGSFFANDAPYADVNLLGRLNKSNIVAVV